MTAETLNDPSKIDVLKRYGTTVVRPTRRDDLPILAANIRSIDALELHYYSSKEPLTVLRESYANAKFCLTVEDDDSLPSLIFGVGWTANPRVGLVWLLGSNHIQKVKRRFLLESRNFILSFINEHDVLFNHVYDNNHLSKKWLEWLGFEVTAKFPEHGNDRQPFTEYSLFSDPIVRRMYMEKHWPVSAGDVLRHLAPEGQK